MRVELVRGIAIAPFALVLSVHSNASAQDVVDDLTNIEKWDFAIGAGAMVGPKYEGSDENEVTAMPYLSIEWNDFVFLNPEDGLGVHAYQSEDLEVDVSIGYDMGRKESDSSDLAGLGDVDGSVTANLGIEYELGPVSPFLELSKQMGGANGMTAEIGVETMVPLAMLYAGNGGGGARDEGEGPSGPALMFGISTQWADDNYMSENFGITAAQAAASGLSQHTAGSGFKSAGVEAGVMIPFGENWALNMMVEYSVLLGDAADSPVVKDDTQLSGGTFLRYQF